MIVYRDNKRICWEANEIILRLHHSVLLQKPGRAEGTNINCGSSGRVSNIGNTMPILCPQLIVCPRRSLDAIWSLQLRRRKQEHCKSHFNRQSYKCIWGVFRRNPQQTISPGTYRVLLVLEPTATYLSWNPQLTFGRQSGLCTQRIESIQDPGLQGIDGGQ
jgi:hypothetical protein